VSESNRTNIVQPWFGFLIKQFSINTYHITGRWTWPSWAERRLQLKNEIMC